MDDERERWRVEGGHPVDLGRLDPDDRSGAPGNRKATEKASAVLVARLGEMQGRLWAERKRSLLIVLQAMDAGGKDGTIRKVFTGVNPQGVRVHGFKGPSSEELAHDFLWRIHAAAPAQGEIGVFNRSHYEDVLIARVDRLVPGPVWRSRYETIRGFEQGLTLEGTTVVKLFLHISKDEQAERFQARLDDPAKQWKFDQADLLVRAKWDAYQEAFADALGETSTDDCPWYAVPANHKWFRNWAVLRILVETLEAMDPQYPPPAEGLDAVTIT
jgi:PPK2 family polyphosphate:nucleotide phosphotransferase